MLEALVLSMIPLLIGFALRGWLENTRIHRSIRSHIDALRLEIGYCGQLAATYLYQRIQAPHYRLPNDVYRTVFPLLLLEGLIDGEQANVLQRFYLQVDQVNRGLDNVDDFLRGVIAERDEQGITLEQEERRLRAKAIEMQGPTVAAPSDNLYRDAVTVFEAVETQWVNRSWLRRLRQRKRRKV